MWTQFILQNAHFALNILAALIFFAVTWLYLDAWSVKKPGYLGFRVLGYILLSLSFIMHAAYVESPLLESGLINESLHSGVVFFFKSLGFVFIIASLILDPLQKRPEEQSENKVQVQSSAGFLTFSASLSYPILAFVASFLYIQRATIGLERHLRPVAVSFLLLFISEFLSLGFLLQNTKNIDLYRLVAPFGFLWLLQHLFLLLALLSIRKWVFGYLFKRFETQLFIIFTSLILFIYLFTTVAFTGLLVKNLMDEALRQLHTDAKVLDFAIESKKAEVLSDAQVVAGDTNVIGTVKGGQRPELANLVEKAILTKKQSFLDVVNENGKVLARGEEKERFGDSLSDDLVVRRALKGESMSSAFLKESVVSPEVVIRAAVPIKSDNTVIGAILIGTVLDNAFLDGVKKTTGLESSLYAGNKLSATTLLASDGVTRPIGTTLEQKQIKQKVLQRQEEYVGSVTLLSRPYFASYLPLQDIDNNVLGMIFVGRDEATILSTAGRSLQLTFLISILMLILSVIPSYFVSRYLTSQLR